MGFTHIDAVTLVVADMAQSIAFYDVLGLPIVFGGADQPFTTLQCGTGFVNLQLDPASAPQPIWGRAILHVESAAEVDDTHRRLVAAGQSPEAEPADAAWGERYFHVLDPDGHELSIATRL